METLKDWLGTFGKIIVHPTAGTFRDEAKKAPGKLGSAIAWIVVFVITYQVVEYVAGELLIDMYSAFVNVILLPIGFLFFVFCIHLLVKRLFHRKQDHYEEILYLSAGIMLPFMALNILTGRIPVVGLILSWVVDVYTLGLMVIAIKAVTGLKAGQAIRVVLLGSLMAGVGFLCIAIFLLQFLDTIPEFF